MRAFLGASFVVLFVSTDVIVLYLWRLRRRRRASGATQTEVVAA